ncbi:MAG: SIMPL domain-containing protein [Lachnospiraceae bacterium]|nr:SIMPL domain-containing protein [Lachnospiraceae bacterium]
MRTIRVTGKGQIKLKPDMTRISITLEGTYPEYSETLRHSSEDTEAIKDLLTEYGFERSDLKTLDFSVDTEFESYKEHGAYKQRFIGYKYHHLMKVEFDSDNERLGRVLYALASSQLRPEIRISYTIKDQEAAKNQLLGKAVSDAMDKADALAKAARVVLKDIQSIDYSWGHINFEVHPMNRMLVAEEGLALPMAASGTYDMDIEPDDIEVSDTVTLLWEIE